MTQPTTAISKSASISSDNLPSESYDKILAPNSDAQAQATSHQLPNQHHTIKTLNQRLMIIQPTTTDKYFQQPSRNNTHRVNQLHATPGSETNSQRLNNQPMISYTNINREELVLTIKQSSIFVPFLQSENIADWMPDVFAAGYSVSCANGPQVFQTQAADAAGRCTTADLLLAGTPYRQNRAFSLKGYNIALLDQSIM